MLPKKYTRLFVLFLLVVNVAAAQRNVFHFPEKPAFVYHSPYVRFFKIPADSVYNLAYGNRELKASEPWLKTAAYTVPWGKADSFFSTKNIAPGYYLSVSANANQMNVLVRRRASFFTQIHDLRRLKILTVENDRQQRISDVTVTVGKKTVAYDTVYKGYILRDFSNADTVRIQKGDDVEFYLCSVQNTHSGYGYNNWERNHYRPERTFYNGYLVTNKPKYLPGDTVKFKAYIQNPNNNKPVQEPISVHIFNYNYGKEYEIKKTMAAEEPGVYFGEFVLGDSLKADLIYSIEIKGLKSGHTLSQQFRLEDYLLDETFLKVTGETREVYQPGDTAQLYAYAYNSNNLPVLDGKLSITVVPENYSITRDSLIFIPDTLYHATTEVNPDGETYIGFPATGFPQTNMNLRCYVSLVNSNFERKDTSFFLNYKTDATYVSIAQQGNKIKATLIRNKQSVPGTGKIAVSGKDCSQEYAISFPYEYTIQPDDQWVNIYNSDAQVVTYPVPESRFSTDYDFIKDTAYLQISNPEKVWFYYSYYVSNKYIGSGILKGDSLLKIHSRKNRTVTVIGSYKWRGTIYPVRYTIFKYSRALEIKMDKKDFVFPGQTDSIRIHLNNKDNKPVTKTNVTVLAFNNQFKEDYTPELPTSTKSNPAQGSPLITREIYKPAVNYVYAQPTHLWLSKCDADTVFFYKNFFLLPDDVAWLNFDTPEDTLSQVAFYLKKGNEFFLPDMIGIDEKPVYYSAASSVNPQGFFVTPGTHSVQLRMADATYIIPHIDVCKGQKTNMFLNLDSVGTYKVKRVVNDTLKTLNITNHLRWFVYKTNKPDTITSDEKSWLARTLLLYRSEYPEQPLFLQYPMQIRAAVPFSEYGNREGTPKLIGPFRFEDSIYFYQYRNTKLGFEPEIGYIFSFRPQMTRVEKVSIFDYLDHHITDRPVTPDYGFTAPQPENYDTLVVAPKPYWVSVSYQKVQKKEIKYLLGYKAPSIPDSAKTATVLFANRSDSALKYIVLFNPKDTALLQIKIPLLNNSFSIAPGRYEVYLIWKNDSVTHFPSLNIRPYGITIVQAYYKADTRFNYAAPPKEIKPYVHEDSLQNRRTIFAAGSGEVYGTILDYKREPATGAIITVDQNGITKGGATADIDGNYSIKPLPEGRYTVKVLYVAHHTETIQDVIVRNDASTHINVNMQGSEQLKEVVIKYVRPVAGNSYAGANSIIEREYIQNSPSRSVSGVDAMSTGIYQAKSGTGLSIAGARADANLYVIDGVRVNGAPGTLGGLEDVIKETTKDKNGDQFYLNSSKSKSFINDFVGNMMQASGMRKNFRDWAIWEPNLWTDKEGNASFNATYPDNMTSWRTYVLAMNRKGYAAKIMTLTRSFKPLSASLAAPKFLRYGDSIEVIGKVANYTQKPFLLHTEFKENGFSKITDTMTVHNTRVAQLPVYAPVANHYDTTMLPLSYAITTPEGYTDGEERTIPVLPVGVIENKGLFLKLRGDTAITSQPDTAEDYFSGKAQVFIDGSMLEALLREIENLKVDPHGCTEQLTTKLLAVYYEEEIKNALKDAKLNNEKDKKKILEKIIGAQNRDGSFCWWSNSKPDLRVTNYVISTMQKINKDGWLDYVIRRGLNYLNANIEDGSGENIIASLGTLSIGNYPANYKTILRRFDSLKLDDYNRFAIVKIKKEQQLPYRADLDSLMKKAIQTEYGMYWGYSSYDWYRNDLATTLLAYQVVKGDSVYGKYAEKIVDYLLFRRNGGYYENTASSGLVLSTLLPDLLKDLNASDRHKPTRVVISGSIKDSVTEFPKTYEIKDKQAHFRFDKKGISPVFVSVVYNYFNLSPKVHDSVFRVSTVFLKNADTVVSLKQGEKITLRATVTCKRASEYIMIEIPIPAGCVLARDNQRNYNYLEASRENFKDQTDIFCNALSKGTYTFDVVLEARYKGNFTINPARAGMMYFPQEFGNTEVKKVIIK